MHISDVVNAFDIILHKGGDEHVYNIGAKEERTIRSVAEVCVCTAGVLFFLSFRD
jgi:dTDP-D-glucose 4,6-dehydratase